MKKTLLITDKTVFPDKTFEKPEKYDLRPTVKVIVENDEGKIAMVTSKAHGLYLLPGGGAESDNLKKEAERECEEEINYDVDIKKVVAKSEEYRNQSARRYDTTCFSAVVISESPIDTRTNSERENELRVEWFSKDEALKIIDEQHQKLKEGKVELYNIGFNIIRDGYFIRKFLN